MAPLKRVLDGCMRSDLQHLFQFTAVEGKVHNGVL